MKFYNLFDKVIDVVLYKGYFRSDDFTYTYYYIDFNLPNLQGNAFRDDILDLGSTMANILLGRVSI